MVPGGRTRRHSTVHISPSPFPDHPTASLPPRLLCEPALAASLQPFLPRNAFACDEFRMYEFKVRRCGRGRSHDWTECPYAHPGEKARRRDPRRFHYSGAPCPDFRRGGECRRGDSCELAHGVFESWLHPARYRTQPCKDGAACGRRVCFFAHSPEQLRVVVPPSPASPGKGGGSMSSSPTSTLLPPADGSPPVSPMGLEEVALAMRRLQLSQAKSAPPFGTRRGRALLAALGNAMVTPATAEEEVWEAETATVWSLKANLVEAMKREEEAALLDLGWVWELVKD